MPYDQTSIIDKAEAEGLKALQGPSLKELEARAKEKMATKAAQGQPNAKDR